MEMVINRAVRSEMGYKDAWTCRRISYVICAYTQLAEREGVAHTTSIVIGDRRSRRSKLRSQSDRDRRSREFFRGEETGLNSSNSLLATGRQHSELGRFMWGKCCI